MKFKQGREVDPKFLGKTRGSGPIGVPPVHTFREAGFLSPYRTDRVPWMVTEIIILPLFEIEYIFNKNEKNIDPRIATLIADEQSRVSSYPLKSLIAFGFGQYK